MLSQVFGQKTNKVVAVETMIASKEELNSLTNSWRQAGQDAKNMNLPVSIRSNGCDNGICSLNWSPSSKRSH